MATRGLFGQRSGSYGGWFTKPGYDVFSAQPGQFLLDTNSQVFQVVSKGTTLITTDGAGSIPAGTVRSASVGLPSGFAGFANIIAVCNYYIVDNVGNQYSENAISSTYLRWLASGGSIVFDIVSREISGGAPFFNHWAAWSVYRAQY